MPELQRSTSGDESDSFLDESEANLRHAATCAKGGNRFLMDLYLDQAAKLASSDGSDLCPAFVAESNRIRDSLVCDRDFHRAQVEEFLCQAEGYARGGDRSLMDLYIEQAEKHAEKGGCLGESFDAKVLLIRGLMDWERDFHLAQVEDHLQQAREYAKAGNGFLVDIYIGQATKHANKGSALGPAFDAKIKTIRNTLGDVEVYGDDPTAGNDESLHQKEPVEQVVEQPLLPETASPVDFPVHAAEASLGAVERGRINRAATDESEESTLGPALQVKMRTIRDSLDREIDFHVAECEDDLRQAGEYAKRGNRYLMNIFLGHAATHAGKGRCLSAEFEARTKMIRDSLNCECEFHVAKCKDALSDAAHYASEGNRTDMEFYLGRAIKHATDGFMMGPDLDSEIEQIRDSLDCEREFHIAQIEEALRRAREFASRGNRHLMNIFLEQAATHASEGSALDPSLAATMETIRDSLDCECEFHVTMCKDALNDASRYASEGNRSDMEFFLGRAVKHAAEGSTLGPALDAKIKKIRDSLTNAKVTTTTGKEERFDQEEMMEETIEEIAQRPLSPPGGEAVAKTDQKQAPAGAHLEDKQVELPDEQNRESAIKSSPRDNTILEECGQGVEKKTSVVIVDCDESSTDTALTGDTSGINEVSMMTSESSEIKEVSAGVDFNMIMQFLSF